MPARYALLLLLALFLPSCGPGQKSADPSLIKEKDREFVRATLEGMKGAVRLVLFTTPENCEYCELAEVFLADIAAQSSLVTLEVLSLERDASRAGELGVDKAPGIAVLGKKDYGIRYYGLPTGYEFVSFVELIRQVGDKISGLLPATVQALDGLSAPVVITVFSTKT